MGLRERVREAADYLGGRMPFPPDAALVLGSGLGGVASQLADWGKIPMREIPHWPVPSVPGHPGEVIWGRVGPTRLLICSGRVHLYEGYTPQEVALPVHVAAELGARRLLVTNAAGGVNPEFEAGDLMLIVDHVNFMFQNPLVGPSSQQFGPTFPDMSSAYSIRLRDLARQIAQELGIQLKEGVLFGVLGPTYETPAEVEMIRRLGGDAVTMSTIPEVIAARQRGLEVLGISVITNRAGAHGHGAIDHHEVVRVAQLAQERLSHLLFVLLERMPRD
jgi:purine-nucleoside phosphorylase